MQSGSCNALLVGATSAGIRRRFAAQEEKSLQERNDAQRRDREIAEKIRRRDQEEAEQLRALSNRNLIPVIPAGNDSDDTDKRPLL
jgi:hypothetical protein